MFPAAVAQQSVGNVFVADAVDRGPRILWDTITAAAGTTTATQYNFFAHTASVNGKNVTNLVQANKVPPPKAMAVQSVGFAFSPVMFLSDIVGINVNYWFEFKIDNKTFIEGLPFHYPAGGGISGYAATNHGTTALITANNNGDASVLAMRRFNDWPRVIPAGPFFGVIAFLGGTAFTLFSTVASTIVSPAYGGLNWRCDLDGVFDDSVQ